MKIPCVRCGKKIDSPHVYCRDCSRELEGGAEQLAAPRKRSRLLPVMLALIALAGAGFWGYSALPGDTLQQKLAAFKKDVPTVQIIAEKLPDELLPEALKTPQEPETPTESARPSQPAQQDDEVLFTLDTPSTRPDTTLQDEQQTAMDDAAQSEQQDVSEDAPPAPAAQEDEAAPATEDDSQEATLLAGSSEEQPARDEAAESPESDETASEGEEQQADSTQDQATAEPQNIEDGVWVFWLDKEDADEKTVERLQEAGYVNSQAKGQWPGHFNDKNIFYRHEDKRGLDQVREALQDEDFHDYFYNNDRIGQNVKRIFNEHDNVQFVIIVK